MSELTRREAIAGAGALAAGAALAPYLRAAGAVAQSPAAFTLPLRRMPVIRRADIVMPMKLADIPLARGERTLMWTFGGSFPGPTIRRPAGATTRVRFKHRIPNADTFTIHNHGHHSRAVHDGQPMSELIRPGTSREYVYEHVEEGEPLRGAMRWYHDHSHGRTNRNSWMGLMGLFIIEHPVERELRLPRGRRELLLVLTTRTLDDNNQLVDPFSAAADPGADAVGTGNLMLVNGVTRPYFRVEPTSYRVRILNAASFTPYNLGFASGGPEVRQIGNESGLFPAPAKRERVLMGPAERCDLWIDFSKYAGQRVVLSSAPQESDAPLGSLAAPALAPEEKLLEFRVRARRRKFPAPRPLPAKLVPLPKWTAQLSTSPDRTFTFGQAVDPGGRTIWTINGAPYDPDQIAAQPQLGTTETWLLVNSSQQIALHPPARRGLEGRLAQRRHAGRRRGRPQGDLPPRSRRDPGGGRQVHRPRREVPHPLPHAQPRGPRDDDHVRDRRRRGRPRRTGLTRGLRGGRRRRARARPARHAHARRSRAGARHAGRPGQGSGPPGAGPGPTSAPGGQHLFRLPALTQGDQPMNRKRFLAGGAGLTAASLLPGRAVAPAAAAATASLGGLLPPERIGLQLYSVADQVSSIGFAKVLEELAQIGYKLVEFAGYEDSTGLTVQQLRKLLDDNGLKAIGSHVSPNGDESMKQILADAAVLGIPNVGISLPLPSQGPTAAGWKALSQEYNRYGEMAAKEGVGFYLHNHFHEWFPTPDDPTKRGEDVLLAETDPRYVFFEMDIYWAHVGQSQSGSILAFDPLMDYAIPHKDRYKLFHVKDGRKNSITQDYNDAFTNITDAGQGSIDFRTFFETLFATAPGEVERHHYLWERDNASDHPRGSMASARASFTYIRYGLTTESGGGGVARSVPAAVTGVAFKGRRLRVSIETDETVKARLNLRRGRRRLARRGGIELAPGKHVVTLRVPKGTGGGPSRLTVTFTAGGRSHHIRLPVTLP